MPYQLDINLKQTAALQAAISFWNKQYVKDRVVEFFNVYDKHDDNDENKVRNHWHQLTKEVLETWNYGLLPRGLEVELIYITKEIGRKIFDWLQYIKWYSLHYFEVKTQLPEERIMDISNICWTSYGTIDEVNTYKTFLLNKPNFSVVKSYKIACVNALEDEIDYLWQKIPKSLQQKFNDDMGWDNDRYILAYWRCHRDGNLRQLKNYFDRWYSHYDDELRIRDALDNPPYEENLSTEENMLLVSVQKCYYNAVKYFWGKLTTDQRNHNIIECLHITLRCYIEDKVYNNNVTSYKSEKWIEILLFLMSQISSEQKEAFHNTTVEAMICEEYEELNVNEFILWMLSFTWPWQNLLIPALNDMLQRQKLSGKMAYILLGEIANMIVEHHKLGFNVNNSKLQSLLHAVWWNLPINIKQAMAKEPKAFVSEYQIQDLISNLLDARDLISLNIIFNDPEVVNVRNKFIRLGQNKCEQLIINDNYEIVDQFIETILKSDNEKTSFKQNIKAYGYFIKKGEFYLADKFFDWQCWRPEKKLNVKNQLDNIALGIIIYIMNEYDLADRFINWKCKTRQEKKMSKNFFKNSINTIFWIYTMWSICSSNTDEAIERCLKFLNWLFESDDEINQFLKQKFATNSTKQFFVTSLVPPEVIKRFLCWCGLTEDDIQETTSIE